MDWKKWIIATGIGVAAGVIAHSALTPTPKPTAPVVQVITAPANPAPEAVTVAVAPRPDLTSAKPAPVGTVWGHDGAAHCTTAQIYLVAVNGNTPTCRCVTSGAYLPCPPPDVQKPK